jgi:6,7-dimethyl-8-ribityllumazine synthase
MDSPAHVLIIEARFYGDIMDAMVSGARAALQKAGATFEHVVVPGALEVPAAVGLAAMAGREGKLARPFDGFLALGCVIRGETTHYETVAAESARGLQQLAVDQGRPRQRHPDRGERGAGLGQARSSAGWGRDAARACLAMVHCAAGEFPNDRPEGRAARGKAERVGRCALAPDLRPRRRHCGRRRETGPRRSSPNSPTTGSARMSMALTAVGRPELFPELVLGWSLTPPKRRYDRGRFAADWSVERLEATLRRSCVAARTSWHIELHSARVTIAEYVYADALRRQGNRPGERRTR